MSIIWFLCAFFLHSCTVKMCWLFLKHYVKSNTFIFSQATCAPNRFVHVNITFKVNVRASEPWLTIEGLCERCHPKCLNSLWWSFFDDVCGLSAKFNDISTNVFPQIVTGELTFTSKFYHFVPVLLLMLPSIATSFFPPSYFPPFFISLLPLHPPPYSPHSPSSSDTSFLLLYCPGASHWPYAPSFTFYGFSSRTPLPPPNHPCGPLLPS